MMSALLYLISATAQAGEPRPQSLDLLLLDVTEACLLPDLDVVDPGLYLSGHGWARITHSHTLEKRIGSASYSVTIKWPASDRFAASCSFDSEDTTAVKVYDWFRHRIGEPRDIAWSDQQVAGWKIQTNGHDVGVYVSRKRTNGNGNGNEGMMLHVLQGQAGRKRR